MVRSRWRIAWSLVGLLVASAAQGALPSTDAEQLAAAGRHIADREYRASENRMGLQAPNRAHDLRTYFSARGIRVQGRGAGAGAELLQLSLAGVGRCEAVTVLPPGDRVVADGRRIEIQRPGLVEWYVNSPEGLEQGFTLEKRPKGKGELVVELSLAGAKAELRDQAIFISTGDRRLRYGELFANDARDRKLAAHFEVPTPDRIRIVVNDAEASYPIVIDPLLTETADAQLESDQSSAQMGVSVAGAGDVNGDGYADVIVGAPYYDAGQNDEGAAFIFHGGPSGITTGGVASAATQLEANQSNNPLLDTSPLFGFSVSGAGDVNGDGYDDVIVGAPFYDAGELDEGAAFVFLGSASGIPDGSPATAAAQLESNLAASFSFPLVAATSFGRSVSGAGDANGDGYSDVMVSAPGFDAGQDNEGAVFIFLGSAAGIADGNPSTAHARLESNQSNAGFGGSLSGAGDVNADGYADVIVGADSYQGKGAAFVFYGGPAGFPNSSPASAGVTELVSTQTGSAFGTSVAGAGDVDGDGYADVIVGAPSYDTFGGSDEGSAFVFGGGASGIADGGEATGSRLFSDQSGGRFGHAVAGAGDVDGDGYADVVVGAYQYDARQVDEGAMFVALGAETGIGAVTPASTLRRVESDQADAWLGWSVAGAGDVNGDGYSDVIVGAQLFDAGQSNEGRAFVSLGSPSGPTYTTDFAASVPFRGSVSGSALIEGGALKLTRALNFQSGYFLLDDLDPGIPSGGFAARFRAYVGGGTCCSSTTADGFSFNFANDLPADYPGEEGGGTGLTVSFDSWLNQESPGDAAPAIDVKWGGVLIGRALVPVSQGVNAPVNYWDVFIRLDPDGTLDVSYNDAVIYSNLPTGFTSILGGRFGFGARTGGANDNHWIDDLRISTIRAVPEPSAPVMLCVGLVTLTCLRRKRRGPPANDPALD